MALIQIEVKSEECITKTIDADDGDYCIINLEDFEDQEKSCDQDDNEVVTMAICKQDYSDGKASDDMTSRKHKQGEDSFTEKNEFHSDCSLTNMPQHVYMCCNCGKTYSSAKLLELHENVDMYRCKLCNQTFCEYALFKEHQKGHRQSLVLLPQSKSKGHDTPVDIFKEVHPDVTYYSPISQSGKSLHQCKFCRKGFKRSSYLKAHVSKGKCKPCDQLYQCEQCKDVFNNEFDWKEHETTHPDVSISSNEFDITSMSRKSSVQCNYCHKRFKLKSKLRKHKKKKHSEYVIDLKSQLPLPESESNSGSFQCRFCFKSFLHYSHYTLHQLEHTRKNQSTDTDNNVVLYKCSVCKMRFLHKTNRDNHEKFHTGEHVLKCKFCGKTYVRKNHFKDHLKTHTGKGLYECKYCKKTYYNLAACRRHERVNHSKRYFPPKSK